MSNRYTISDVIIRCTLGFDQESLKAFQCGQEEIMIPEWVQNIHAALLKIIHSLFGGSN